MTTPPMPSSPANYLWNVSVGDYELTIDRKTLTYRLVETKTGTVWADGLAVGSIEFEDRATGERQTVDFGAAKLVSLSEKAGAQGKRILFGLDWNGVPIDITVTATQREVQWIVEASRDTKAHRVQDITLLPGLCAVPDPSSYLVLPIGEGWLGFGAADGVERRESLQVWDPDGVTMPFLGAVRTVGGETTALSLITDSAYAVFDTAEPGDGSAAAAVRFTRDPERRRLELRVGVLPGENHVGVARAYREKVVAERGHVTLRRKMRDQPLVERLIGAAHVYVHPDRQAPDAAERLRSELGVEDVVWQATTVEDARGFGQDRYGGDVLAVAIFDTADGPAEVDPAQVQAETGAEMVLTNVAGSPLEDGSNGSRWDDMDARLERFASLRTVFPLVDTSGTCDWSALAAHSWDVPYNDPYERLWNGGVKAPLQAVVYHDSVILPVDFHGFPLELFLRGLLNLTVPELFLVYLYPSESCAAKMSTRSDLYRTMTERICAVLLPLHKLSFAAFLNAHRFLTPDFNVEEARYTNGARVVINQSATDDYETDDLHLPPLGFYVEHAQMVAHDARRVGAEMFPARVWRIARSRDDRPLVESADVLRQEFPV